VLRRSRVNAKVEADGCSHRAASCPNALGLPAHLARQLGAGSLGVDCCVVGPDHDPPRDTPDPARIHEPSRRRARCRLRRRRAERVRERRRRSRSVDAVRELAIPFSNPRSARQALLSVTAAVVLIESRADVERFDIRVNDLLRDGKSTAATSSSAIVEPLRPIHLERDGLAVLVDRRTQSGVARGLLQVGGTTATSTKRRQRSMAAVATRVVHSVEISARGDASSSQAIEKGRVSFLTPALLSRLSTRPVSAAASPHRELRGYRFLLSDFSACAIAFA
jgi:hypothetical protein